MGATITPDTRWMTYQEAADFLGVKVESARRRAQRDEWPRQLGNDGRTRVGIPGDIAAGSGASGAMNTGDDHPHPGEVEALREALARERERADRVETEMADLRIKLDQTERERAEAREELRQAQGEVDGMKLGLEHMHEVLAQARREAAETGAKGEQAARAAKDANERLARLHSRGVWARLRNRP